MKAVCFGEIMLRLNPQGHDRFLQTDVFVANYAGAEANVAVCMSNLGIDAHFISKLPEHEIGQMTINAMRRYGVNTNGVVRGGDRIGLFYLEKGASQRPSKVIYDRAGSAIAEAVPADFDWKSILKGAKWFHVTGITPALSENAAQITIDACKAAKELGITVSTDLNYRKKLWTKDEARKTMTEVCKYVDYCIANEEDAKDVFGIEADNTDIESGKLNREGYISVAKKLTEAFGFKGVAITLRESISANDNKWSAMLYTDGDAYFSRKYDMHIVDRVGGGDSFGAGLIYSIVNGFDNQKAIEFAVAASCLKHSIEGDYNMVSVSEVESLAKGSGSGRVQR